MIPQSNEPDVTTYLQQLNDAQLRLMFPLVNARLQEWIRAELAHRDLLERGAQTAIQGARRNAA